MTQSRAEINSFEDEDPKPVPRSLTEEGSVRGRSLQHLLQPDQPGSAGQLFSSLRTDRPGFFVSIVSSQITGNEVLISYRKSETRKTRLIGVN